MQGWSKSVEHEGINYVTRVVGEGGVVCKNGVGGARMDREKDNEVYVWKQRERL